MASTTRVTIVIPNYNGREHLESLLSSVADQTWRAYEVVVVDDCSPDRAAVEYIKTFVRDHANMRLVENEENLGFVKTCNKGFRLATSDYVCILTNDTTVEKNFVERNVQIMDADGSIGVLSCIVVDQRGNNWFSGGLFRAGIPVSLHDDFEGVRPVDWVAGTACFYRKELLDKVGLLDESLVMYHEDIDFCLRVRRQTDYGACMFSEKLVTHFVEEVDDPRSIAPAKQERLCYYLNRNHLLLVRRHSPRYIPKAVLRSLREATALLAFSVLSLLRLKPLPPSRYFHLAIVVVRGLRHGLTQKA
jgi:GT2 family glycosyltransferase